jgi:hypothetical protein
MTVSIPAAFDRQGTGGEMKLWLALALVTLLPASQESFLTRLEGRWSGAGTVLNQSSKIEMEWAWILGGQFFHLAFRNEMGSPPKVTLFEGKAYYRAIGEGRYRGTWFDNSGMTRPIEAVRSGDALVSRWGTPETEEGETTYQLTGSGRLEMTDRVKGKDGTWRTFGRSELTKR